MKRCRKDFGTEGENKAADFLKQKGYEWVAQNVYTRFGEIDVIVSQNQTLVFVEVKTRTPASAARLGRGSQAVDKTKQTRISRSAAVFLDEHPAFDDYTFRFDVVEVYQGVNGTWKIHHIEDAFDCVNGIYL
ncbi:MAG TPA: YraN family protein [Clostridiales bacterium]|jgi:putative endonuclease|nr:YraN family protein [Clostridiales bacterium]HBE14460.1 YraN family protein [Clostridiales bacterium]HCG35095.1 YraN family protein [Clostridiales bacterium]